MMNTASSAAELFQSADYTKEKHVPVIDAPSRAKKGEFFDIAVSIGKEVSHPNTTAHHIKWITVYFQPSGEKYPYEIGRMEFSSHGASVNGPDSSSVYTHHGGTLRFKTDKPGTIYATSYCNIHGLWQNTQELPLE
jgi:superoxide reductase